MNGEHISRALNHLPDDMVNEAMTPRKAIPWKRITAVAAVLAILLTTLLWPGESSAPNALVEAPGVLKVYACEAEQFDTANLTELELPSDKLFLKGIYSPYLGMTHWALPITFYIDESYYTNSTMTFDISSPYPDFCQRTILQNGESIRLNYVPSEILLDVGNEGSFYLDVIIRADDAVVGYGIISFCFSGLIYYAYQFDTVCFPYVDEKPQNVSLEYVQQRIAEYKESQVYGEGVAYVKSIIAEDEQNRAERGEN